MPQKLTIHQGEITFCHNHAHISTLLGSCVSVVIWHPGKQFGGMCHYVLATTSEFKNQANIIRFNYAEYALKHLLLVMKQVAPLHEFKVGIFGGSDMNTASQSVNIGKNNIQAALQWVETNNIPLVQQDIGGGKSRMVHFKTKTGTVTVNKTRFPLR